MTDTDKAAFIKRLALVAEAIGAMKTSQEAHRFLAGAVLLDCAGVKDPKVRESALKLWNQQPSSLGCNASAFNQALGLVAPAGAKPEKKLAGI